jgi:thioredoxin 1
VQAARLAKAQAKGCRHSTCTFAAPDAGVDDDAEPDGGWWLKGREEAGTVVIDSTQALLQCLSREDKLVVLHFYARWCGACKALHPKASQVLAERSGQCVHALVDFDSNKAMAKQLGVKVLPFFQLYAGAKGKVDEFSCTLTKVQRLRDALESHSAA